MRIKDSPTTLCSNRHTSAMTRARPLAYRHCVPIVNNGGGRLGADRARAGRRIAATILGTEGTILLLIGLYGLAIVVFKELGALGPCPLYNVDSHSGYAHSIAGDSLLVAAVLVISLIFVVAAWRLLRSSRIGWFVALLAQLTVLLAVLSRRDVFSAFLLPSLMAVFGATLGLVGLTSCLSFTFGHQSRRE